MAEVDNGRRSDDIDKRCRLAEDRAEEAKREEEGLRLNLKLRYRAERDFAQKLASGRHRGRGAR